MLCSAERQETIRKHLIKTAQTPSNTLEFPKIPDDISGVDLHRILSELRDYRGQLDEAILVLQRIASGQRRRGRPPKWLNQITAAPEPRVKGAAAAEKGRSAK